MTTLPARVSCTPRDGPRGFTLIEMLITLLVLGIAMLGLMMILQGSVASRYATMNGIETRTTAAAALEMIANDLRSAGSGVDAGYTTPQRAIAYVDSLELIVCGDLSGGVTTPTDTLAYNPSGMPKPAKLVGAYIPPIKYRTGAELIRWTMDLNNDGAVNASDIANANGVDVRRTPNPNDYMMVRQIYGDSLNCVAGDNGGAISRVAPIRKPGGGIPVLFTVNMVNGTTYNWSLGAIPADQLKNIASITVQVTTESARADAKGRYARVTLRTTVSLKRIS